MTLGSVALSLSGSGHLLVYQLGACKTLLKCGALKVDYIAGSSGGAIAAALLTHDVDVDDYVKEFIERRGKGLTMVKQLIESSKMIEDGPDLAIATTRCDDGHLQMFEYFSSKSRAEDPLTSDTTVTSNLKYAAIRRPMSGKENLFTVLDASCRIPTSFHPVDIISSRHRIYGDHEGIRIGEHHYVDGGIAAPAPPTPPALNRIIITPLVGGTHRQASTNKSLAPDIADNISTLHRISPEARYLTLSRPTIELNHDMSIPMFSFDNLRVLRMSMGAIRSSELQEWYLMGQADAEQFLEDL